jgi:Fe-S cluster assembly protein SufD
MEQFPDLLKFRFNDSAYEYRVESFKAFLRAPPKKHKESPTTSDYVSISDEDLDRLLSQDATETVVAGNYESDISVIDGTVTAVSHDDVYFGDMRSAMETFPDIFRDLVYKEIGNDRMENLINAAWENGFFIKVPDSSRGLNISIVESSDRHSLSLKSVILVGDDSSVDITHSCYSNASPGSVHGKTVYLFIGKRSKVRFNYLQEKSKSITDLTYVKSFLSDYAEFKIFHVNRGSEKVVFANESIMRGEGSDFRTFGVSFTDGRQEMDIRDSSFQIGKNAYADVQVRGAVSGESKTMHRGNIDIEEQSILSNGFYDSKILLLSEQGYANSKPALIIKNNNTKSKHGSAISSIDEDQILYLRSRGIDSDMAKSMITEGFLGYSMERSGNDMLMKKVHDFAQAMMSDEKR